MFLQEAVPKYSQELKYSDKRNLQCTNQMLKIHLQLPIPIFLALSDKHAFQLLCLQKAFFSILHTQIYLGKSLVLTQSNILACFINSRIKNNYNLFFSFFCQSVLSVTTHTHTQYHRSTKICVLSVSISSHQCTL